MIYHFSNHIYHPLMRMNERAIALFVFLSSLKTSGSTKIQTDLPAMRKALNLANNDTNNKSIYAALKELRQNIEFANFKIFENDKIIEYKTWEASLISGFGQRKNWKAHFEIEFDEIVQKFENAIQKKLGNYFKLNTNLPKFAHKHSLKLYLMYQKSNDLNQGFIQYSKKEFCQIFGFAESNSVNKCILLIQNAIKELESKYVYLNVVFNDKKQKFEIKFETTLTQKSVSKTVKKPTKPNKKVKFNAFVARLKKKVELNQEHLFIPTPQDSEFNGFIYVLHRDTKLLHYKHNGNKVEFLEADRLFKVLYHKNYDFFYN